MKTKMNKQEVVEKLKERLTLDSEITPSEFGGGYNLGIKNAIAIVGELDEPEKAVVPQFVADWIEKSRSLNFELYEAIYVNDEDAKSDWIMDNSEIFAKAWIYGYEVEKEKLYTVEIPNPNSIGGKLVLFKQQSTGRLILNMLNSSINKPKYLHLTESEIKQDFEWAWQFAKEVDE